MSSRPRATGKLAANWVINELFGRLKKEEHSITESPVSPAQLGKIITLIKSGAISGKIAKDLFEIVYTEGGDPDQIVEARGMKQVTDTGAIEAAVDRDHRRQPRTGGKGETEPQARGLVRGPGDEGHGRQGEPQGGERDRFRQTRALARLAETIRARQRTGLPVRESHRAAAYPEGMRESGTR
jgi:hypothetical protein